LILIAIVHIALISVFTHFFHKALQKEALGGGYFIWGLRLKILAGVVFGVLYRLYYEDGGDTHFIFGEAVVLAEYAWISPWGYLKAMLWSDWGEARAMLFLTEQPRAMLMAKIESVFCLLTGNNYWLSSFYFSIISYAGMWYLANVLATIFPKSKKAAAGAFLFFPSVVFWSAGLSKEALLMCLLSVSVAFFLEYQYQGRFSKRRLLFVLLAFVCIWKLKYYYAAALFPLLLAWYGASRLGRFSFFENIWRQAALLLFLYGTLLGLATFLHPNLRFQAFVEALWANQELMRLRSSPDNLIHYQDLEATWQSYLWHSPWALFSGLFRPLPWEMYRLVYLLPALENTLLLLLSGYQLGLLCLIFFKKLPSRRGWGWFFSTYSKNTLLPLLALLLYTALLAVLLALSSPNFGTLLRYKVGFLPFFAYLLLLYPLAQWEAYQQKKALPPERNSALE
jgi:hypothetical protein